MGKKRKKNRKKNRKNISSRKTNRVDEVVEVSNVETDVVVDSVDGVDSVNKKTYEKNMRFIVELDKKCASFLDKVDSDVRRAIQNVGQRVLDIHDSEGLRRSLAVLLASCAKAIDEIDDVVSPEIISLVSGNDSTASSVKSGVETSSKYMVTLMRFVRRVIDEANEIEEDVLVGLYPKDLIDDAEKLMDVFVANQIDRAREFSMKAAARFKDDPAFDVPSYARENGIGQDVASAVQSLVGIVGAVICVASARLRYPRSDLARVFPGGFKRMMKPMFKEAMPASIHLVVTEPAYRVIL